jgi:HPt (histidine-containing phosphotransfer) domain-containing protein
VPASSEQVRQGVFVSMYDQSALNPADADSADADSLDWSSIDPSALEPITAMDPDGSAGLVVQVLDLYLVDSAERVAEAQRAMATGDLETARRAAHSLKTLGATIGIPALTGTAAHLEAALRAGDLDLSALGLNCIVESLPVCNARVGALRQQFTV